MYNCSRFIRALMAWAVSVNVLAANFFPATVPDLITAITTANANAQNDVIDLGGGTFTLTAVDNGSNGLPVIAADSGNTLLIQNGTIERDLAAPQFRLIEIGNGAELSLDIVAFRNGNAGVQGGGAIFVNATGILRSINKSTFDNNTSSIGGAIHDTSPMSTTINNSTFSNNSSSSGGAIFIANAEGVSISNSTFSGNSSEFNGGAIATQLGPIEIYNSTITNNLAGGFGGGISLGGSTDIIMISTIVAENTAPSGPDIRNLSAGTITESFNLIGNDTSSGFTAGSPNINNSFVGTAISPIDPMLAALANNGGPTQTHALLAGSVAIDAGSNPLGLFYDQRGPGFLRERPPADIGAFELQDCADADADGVCDDVDNCIDISNLDQLDTDGDGLGDVCDPCPNDRFNDADDDTVCGDVDNCPFKANLDQADADDDGMGDACDTCTDSDEDGVCDDADNCPDDANADQGDFDGDGAGDACDDCTDIDGDGVGDPGFDNSLCEDADADDNCVFKANEDQLDTDDDGMGDACDTDICVDADEDNVCDYEDNCLELANEDQADADGDGLGDACDDCPEDRFNDADADGVCGDVDNCPFDANPDQTDTDEDDIGNACDWCPADAGDDNDEDEDGICDAADHCPGHDDALDDDDDGIPDDCDNCPFDYNNDQFDIDQDGVGDECDDDVVIVTPPIAPPLAPWPPFAGPVGVGGAGGPAIAEPVAPVAVDRAPATADLPAVEKAPRSNVHVITIDPKELRGEQEEVVSYPEDLGGGCSLISGPGQTANNLWMIVVLMSLWLRRRKSA